MVLLIALFVSMAYVALASVPTVVWRVEMIPVVKRTHRRRSLHSDSLPEGRG